MTYFAHYQKGNSTMEKGLTFVYRNQIKSIPTPHVEQNKKFMYFCAATRFLSKTEPQSHPFEKLLT